MNMKIKMIFVLLLGVVVLCSCKENNWLDWKSRNELWLANNAKQEGVITTPTGLQYKCIEKGWEKSPRPDDAKIVTITYTGTLINEFEFDSTYDVKENKHIPTDLYVSEVVAGFAEGLKKMNQFSEYEFYIPYQLGYGAEGRGIEGAPGFIPPYSTLIFRVYLASVN
jgi:FKBP-type peptidyl-prolyl cis-trans isomerase